MCIFIVICLLPSYNYCSIHTGTGGFPSNLGNSNNNNMMYGTNGISNSNNNSTSATTEYQDSNISPNHTISNMNVATGSGGGNVNTVMMLNNLQDPSTSMHYSFFCFFFSSSLFFFFLCVFIVFFFFSFFLSLNLLCFICLSVDGFKVVFDREVSIEVRQTIEDEEVVNLKNNIFFILYSLFFILYSLFFILYSLFYNDIVELTSNYLLLTTSNYCYSQPLLLLPLIQDFGQLQSLRFKICVLVFLFVTRNE